MAKGDKIIIQIEGVEELAPKKSKEQKTDPNKEYYDEGRVEMVTGTFKYAKNQVVPIINKAIRMGWNRYTTLQEDYLAENRVNNLMMSVDKVKSLSSSMVSGGVTGAQIGSIAGPIGTAVGTLVGTLTSITMWGTQNHLDNQQKLSDYYKQLNQTNFQTYLDSSRAGLVNNGRGTEN